MESDITADSERDAGTNKFLNNNSILQHLGISSLYPPKRKLTPKRALFISPEKSSPSKHTDQDRKRKRIDSESDYPNKISRSTSVELKATSNNSNSHTKTLTRSQSMTAFSLQTQDIVAHRKKKMIWAVAEALRSRNIDLKHPQFKLFASYLAKLIRHFLPTLFTAGQRPEGSSTENMLRIARQYVFPVTRGKTAEQIIQASKNQIPISRPSGYVGLDSKEMPVRSKENILQDRINVISSETSHVNRNSRIMNIERIRRVINFGDEVTSRNQNSNR